MAMMRNIDTKIAVATKPKEMAFMDVPKSFRDASLSVDSGGAGLELQSCGLSPNPFIVFFTANRIRIQPCSKNPSNKLLSVGNQCFY